MSGNTEGQSVGAVRLPLDSRHLAAQEHDGLRDLRDDQQLLALLDGVGQQQRETARAQVFDDGAHAEALLAGRYVERHGRQRAADARNLAPLGRGLRFQFEFGVQRRASLYSNYPVELPGRYELRKRVCRAA